MDPSDIDFTLGCAVFDVFPTAPTLPDFDLSTFTSFDQVSSIMAPLNPLSSMSQPSNSAAGSGSDSGLGTAIVDAVDGVVDTLFPNNNGSGAVDANSLVESAVEGVVKGVAKFAFTKLRESITSHTQQHTASTMVQQPVAVHSTSHVQIPQIAPNHIGQTPPQGAMSYLSMQDIPPPPPLQQIYHAYNQMQSPPSRPFSVSVLHTPTQSQAISVSAHQSNHSHYPEIQSSHLQPAPAQSGPSLQMGHHATHTGHYSLSSVHPVASAQQQQAQHHVQMSMHPTASVGHSHQTSISSSHQHYVQQQSPPLSASISYPGQIHNASSGSPLARPSSIYSHSQATPNYPPSHSHSASLHSYPFARPPTPPDLQIHTKPDGRLQHRPFPSHHASLDSTIKPLSGHPPPRRPHRVTSDIDNYRPLLALSPKRTYDVAPVSLYGAAVSGHIGPVHAKPKSYGGL
jgi:hypothetical protein